MVSYIRDRLIYIVERLYHFETQRDSEHKNIRHERKKGACFLVVAIYCNTRSILQHVQTAEIHLKSIYTKIVNRNVKYLMHISSVYPD